jgi:tetratricopeptide (TPR) repeat protein
LFCDRLLWVLFLGVFIIGRKLPQLVCMNSPSESDSPPSFDVFLCYNSKDKLAIRATAQQLRDRGISYWLDEEQLPPGCNWAETQQRDMFQSKAVAIFVGKNGIKKRYQDLEIYVFLMKYARERQLRIIPVFLADAPPETELMPFLQLFTWVDFRLTDPDPMQRLIQGITLDPPQVNLNLAAIADEIRAIVPNNITLPGAIAFVGRDQDIQTLDHLLQQENPVSICAVAGMGGIGKTELALQYAYQQRDLATYPGGVCWLKAREDLAAQVIAFGRSHLNLNPPTDLEFAEQLRWCWQHWGESKTLMVLDDVQDYADVQKLGIPGRSHFKVLLTTRSHFGKSVRELPLNVLSEAAALELLGAIVSDRRIEQGLDSAKELCQWLGYLPLGVELVGRYLDFDPDLSVAALLAELHQNKLAAEALLAAEPGMTAELGVVAAFELSWERLTAEAQRVAAFLSLFALSEFPWAWVQECLSDVEASMLNQIRVRQLLGLYLLQRSGEGLYQLHQLLREFFAVKRQQMAEEEGMKRSFCRVMVAVAQQIPQTPTLSQIEQFQPVIPHLQEVATNLHSVLPDADVIEPANRIAWFYQGQVDYDEAEFWHKHCLEMVTARLGVDHPETATSLNNLALLYQSQGRYADAELLLQQSLQIYETHLGAYHPAMAYSLTNLASLYQLQGRYADAEPLFRQSLQIYENFLEAYYPETATSLNNLALLHYLQGRYADAEMLHQRALQIRETHLGVDHLDTAGSLNNLASLYQSQGRYSDAEPLFCRSLQIYETQLGVDHPDIAVVLDNLAMLYGSQGRYAEAETVCLRSSQIIETQLGTDHPATAISLNNLALLYYSQEHYTEAEPLFCRSLQIYETQLGVDHPDTASSLSNLALLYESQGRYGEAEPLCLRSLQIRETHLGADHPDTALSLNNLALLYYSQARYAEAEPLYVKAITIFYQRLGEEHPNTTNAFNNFYTYLQKALAAGQGDRLSDHPLTQALLAQLRQE